MSNKAKLEQEANKYGYTIGCYNAKMDLLKPAQLRKVLDEIYFESSTDVDVAINRRKHVVEISFVDNEVDFNVLTKAEYIGRYGDERWAD